MPVKGEWAFPPNVKFCVMDRHWWFYFLLVGNQSMGFFFSCNTPPSSLCLGLMDKQSSFHKVWQRYCFSTLLLLCFMLSASLFSLHPKHHMLIHDNILTDLGHKVCFTIFGDICGGAEYVKNGASLIQPTQKKMVFFVRSLSQQWITNAWCTNGHGLTSALSLLKIAHSEEGQRENSGEFNLSLLISVSCCSEQW